MFCFVPPVPPPDDGPRVQPEVRSQMAPPSPAPAARPRARSADWQKRSAEAYRTESARLGKLFLTRRPRHREIDLDCPNPRRAPRWPRRAPPRRRGLGRSADWQKRSAEEYRAQVGPGRGRPPAPHPSPLLLSGIFHFGRQTHTLPGGRNLHTWPRTPSACGLFGPIVQATSSPARSCPGTPARSTGARPSRPPTPSGRLCRANSR